MRKHIVAAVRALTVGALLVFVGGAGAQQGFPNRSIKIITPYQAGSSVDTVARLVGAKLSEKLGQPVLVEARPGANTVIGSEALVKSAPDGYTLLLISTTHVLNGLLLAALPYDTIKDFAPVATIASSELILVARESLPASNVKELIALGKAKPGGVTYATSSAGGPTHLAAELFSAMTGVKLSHIPYKGSGPAVNDMLGGHVDIGWTSPIAVIPQIKAGRLKAIAISGDARPAAMPEVPTFAESGLKGFDTRFWYALLAPAGTPKEILEKLSAEVGKIVVTPDMRAMLARQGADPFVSTPDQFAELIRSDTAKYAEIIKTANIQLAK